MVASRQHAWEHLLRQAGLRVTKPRLAVLDEVRAESHITADRVAERVRARLGTVSTQAVYDVLNVLTDRGLLRRFEPAGSVMRFEVNAHDNHHHLVCRRCGVVTDVPCAVGSMPCAEPADSRGFLVEEAEVTYWGVCPSCAENPSPAPSEARGT